MIDKDFRCSLEDGIVILDDLDQCVVGFDVRDGRLIYDRDLIVKSLIWRDGMSAEDADEFVSYNIDCAYMGELTPVIMIRE